ncbi:MAG: hypothetical protein ACQES9_10245 [Myxococcota bacterium]
MKNIFLILIFTVIFSSESRAQDSDYPEESSNYAEPEPSVYAKPEPARYSKEPHRKKSGFHNSKPNEKDYHSLSLTVSPFHFLMPVFEFTMEIKLAETFGAALICGGGSVTVNEGDYDETEVGLFEFGAQLKYYLSGNFAKGFHLGVESMYVVADTEVDEVSGTGTGFHLGLFGGYKYTFNNGITLEAQAGYQQYLIRAEASDGVNTASEEQSSGGLLLNLNAGFSF